MDFTPFEVSPTLAKVAHGNHASAPSGIVTRARSRATRTTAPWQRSPSDQGRLTLRWYHADSSPPRYIDIGPHGGYRFTDTRSHHRRLVEGDIVAFVGNDMSVRTNADRAAELVIVVTEPPHDVAGSWTMTVQGATYHRSAP